MTTIRRVFDPSIEMPDETTPVPPGADPTTFVAGTVRDDIAWTREVNNVVEHEAAFYASGASVRYVLDHGHGHVVQTDTYTIEETP